MLSRKTRHCGYGFSRSRLVARAYYKTSKKYGKWNSWLVNVLDVGFTRIVQTVQSLVTRLIVALGDMGITSSCRERYTCSS